MPPAAPTNEPQWPPRSPHEALVSTPGGRSRYRQMQNQTSPSPSPAKKRGSWNGPTRNLMAAMDLDGDDDDEETLQLKLQEIQARLRLKKLQKSKRASIDEGSNSGASFSHPSLSQASTTGSASNSFSRGRSTAGTTPPKGEPRSPKRNNSSNHHSNNNSSSNNSNNKTAVQVPASPVRKAAPAQSQTSPSRVLLGIDKGLKAKDISLKRAPSFRKSLQEDGPSQTGGYLRRTRTPNPNSSFEAPRPMSFNERLASARNEETAKAEKQERISKSRSHAFSIGQQEMEQYKQNAVEIPDRPSPATSFSREEVLPHATGRVRRSQTMSSLTGPARPNSAAPILIQSKSAKTKTPDDGGSSFEPYSSFHLTKRILPHAILARHVSGKKVFNIKDLLKVVKAPDFALPEIEQDIVVFATLAKKSEPRAHKPTAPKNGLKQEDRGKYMVMTLCDLEFEVDLFLFNTGFERFWKLTEGTVIAILNPNVMPPPPGRQDTGKFSLVISSDEDTIIEIGTSRDLGACQSVKKDGQLCASWVNKKRTNYCEFHSNEAVRKQRSSRLEMNSAGFLNGGGSKWDKWRSREVHNKPEKKDGSKYDRDTGSHWFVSRSMSTADLIDGKDRTPVDRKEKAEFLKRDLEAKEREHEMMKKLGQVGNAAGKEYMRHSGSRVQGEFSFRTSATSTASQATTAFPTIDEHPKPNAKSLGLLSREYPIHLSPVKRKRTDSSYAIGLGISRGKSAMGWGGNLKNKLTRMKEGEKLRKDEHSPVRKKTRFVTDKGIREAGRESLGNDLLDRRITLDDDEDELVILR